MEDDLEKRLSEEPIPCIRWGWRSKLEEGPRTKVRSEVCMGAGRLERSSLMLKKQVTYFKLETNIKWPFNPPTQAILLFIAKFC